MAVAGMNHFTILTDDVDSTVSFYGDLLGLEPGPRPNFNFAGAWLYAGGQPILPILVDALPYFGYQEHGVDYECRQQAGTGLWQVFFFDPNGAKVELDFAASERTPG